MKGFIKVPRSVDGVEVIINIDKIRIVAPSDNGGCCISLDQPLFITQIKFDIHEGVATLKHEHILFESPTSFQDVLSLIEQAQ